MNNQTYLNSYRSPKFKVIEVAFQNVLCASPDYSASGEDGENGGEL